MPPGPVAEGAGWSGELLGCVQSEELGLWFSAQQRTSITCDGDATAGGRQHGAGCAHRGSGLRGGDTLACTASKGDLQYMPGGAGEGTCLVAETTHMPDY